MQYMLLIYRDESKYLSASKSEAEASAASYMAYAEAMKKAGVVSGDCARLRPVTDATTVRVSGGKTNVLNGPYADTKEQLAGYFTIDVPDLDAALAWAARCPGASQGAMEVRPLWTM